jgi:isoamylase
VLDTNDPDRENTPNFQSHDHYQVTGRSLLLFALEVHGETGRVVRRVAFELSANLDPGRP